ncbi:MAG: DnaJ domain-containing protein [Thermostichus sp. DRC_bins_24]
MSDFLDYYKILEVDPQASLNQIKSAYRALCQEYHPDKLPPGTPQKARQYIEEKFKTLNLAYETLRDPQRRQAYDQQRQRFQSFPPSPPPQSQPFVHPELFNPERLHQAAAALEAKQRQMRADYDQELNQIRNQTHEQLKGIGILAKDLDSQVFQTFPELTGGIITCFGIAVVLFAIGWSWLGLIFLAIALILTFSPTYSPEAAQAANRIVREAENRRQKATEHYQHQQSNWQQYCRQRIDFFKSLPPQALQESYIRSLSDQDQLFLLLALKEHQQQHQLNESLRAAAKVAVGIGILAALFGLGLGG